jgi:hypothetical protein
MMFDLPQPFGPTTPINWPGNSKWVGSTKDLKPDNLIDFSCTDVLLSKANWGNIGLNVVIHDDNNLKGI